MSKFENKYNNVLTKEFLEREYVENNKDILAISQGVDCSQTTIWRYLIKYNIKRRPQNFVGKYRNAVEVECQICKKKFFVKRSRIKRTKLKLIFCSRKCRKEYFKHYCIDCGKELTTWRAERCFDCIIKFRRAKNHPQYKWGLPHCEDCNKKLSNYQSKRCADCWIKFNRGKKHWNYKGIKYQCEICNKKISWNSKRCHKHAQEKKWQNKEFKNNQIKLVMRGLQLKPNIPEKTLLKLFKKLNLPYHYVGNGQVILNGFNPDFINYNGQKKIIELYGDYWHKLNSYKNRDKRRILEYSKLGYKTLIVWEKELKDLNKLSYKLLNFNKEGD